MDVEQQCTSYLRALVYATAPGTCTPSLPLPPPFACTAMPMDQAPVVPLRRTQSETNPTTPPPPPPPPPGKRHKKKHRVLIVVVVVVVVFLIVVVLIAIVIVALGVSNSQH